MSNVIPLHRPRLTPGEAAECHGAELAADFLMGLQSGLPLKEMATETGSALLDSQAEYASREERLAELERFIRVLGSFTL